MLANTTSASLRQELHLLIDSLEEQKLQAIYRLFEEEMNPEQRRKALILEERKRYLQGEDKGLSWQQVKEMAKDASLRNGL